MKKTIIAISIVTALSLSQCAPKEQSAETQLNNATEKFEDANKEYLAQMETFKKESNVRIEKNNKQITDFNKRIEKAKKEAKTDYQEKIKALEAKNTDLKKRLDDFKADGNENWENFKKEFNHDMENLGIALKNLTESNTD